ncbi:hypothetical protein [Pseudoduganella namucuonensis]|uniref:Transporter n=1 Tax=Pseudoduganella namucuonensis TaxID=1035707 RepID=A0A1I7KT25_9BURK|nr:hypothetical protein [Pseudoduganella namucuonensis]SFV00587.1 hypothetical protein SAMN05216552_101968 [Pseudoduganella namucuonensis]
MKARVLNIGGAGALALAVALGLASASTRAMAAEPAVPEPLWEINLDTTYARSGDGHAVEAPAAEVFHRVGPRLELTASTAWTVSRPRGGARQSGPASGVLGFKWLLADDGRDATVVLWPQLERRLNNASVRRGLASPNRVLALPLEAKFTVGAVAVELYGGPSFIENEDDQWNLRVKLARACLPRADCTLELERNHTPGVTGQTLMLAGAEWRLNEVLALKTAAGRGFGAATGERVGFALLLGIKAIY